ncbi:MAG: spore cortex biosynthesis protein YabQ [Butyricicoccus pullicaecorum]|nr:spore cortex biosynthesis protein YabQ [Butyricicoccus pullicaecorum]
MIALYQPLAVTMHYFLQAVLLGLCLGVLYDVLSGIRMVYHGHRWTGYVLDSVFGITTLIVYFIFTVTLAAGQVRGFLVVGMAGGAIFCHFAAGWLICAASCKLLKLLAWIISVLHHFIRTVLHFIQMGSGRFQKNLKKIFKKTSISGKKTL